MSKSSHPGADDEGDVRLEPISTEESLADATSSMPKGILLIFTLYCI